MERICYNKSVVKLSLQCIKLRVVQKLLTKRQTVLISFKVNFLLFENYLSFPHIMRFLSYGYVKKHFCTRFRSFRIFTSVFVLICVVTIPAPQTRVEGIG